MPTFFKKLLSPSYIFCNGSKDHVEKDIDIELDATVCVGLVLCRESQLKFTLKPALKSGKQKADAIACSVLPLLGEGWSREGHRSIRSEESCAAWNRREEET